MEIKRIVVSPFQTNCYILTKDEDAVVIDPGSGYKKIVELIGNNHLKAILLTHGHLDHIGAVDKLYKQYKCPIYACKEDEKMLRDPAYNTLASMSACVKAPINWLTEKSLVIGKFNIDVLYTPGHSKGSVMYIVENNLFSGDTLFHLSVGRVDLYGGSQHQLENSLKVLNELDPQMKVYPGHDEPTNVEYELKYNPFLQ